MNGIDKTPNAAGIGAVYVSGIWLARVHYTLLQSAQPFGGALHVLDGERDLFAPPIPAEDFELEMADGQRRSFVPATGNPVSGAYTFAAAPPHIIAA